MGRVPIWRSGHWTGQGLSGAPEIKSLNATFLNNQDEITIFYTVTEKKDFSRTRVVLNESGTLVRSTWLENRWVRYRISLRETCDKYMECGPNGYCDPYNADHFECVCLPGFEPKSTRDWNFKDGSLGCVRKQRVTTCKSGEG
ncbi:g-type lectin s-receptor-like serine/threonine-protein kinase, partial [Fagus crenata]